MSAWSDYRCGAIDEEEFKYLMQRECADDYPEHLDNWEEDEEYEDD